MATSKDGFFTPFIKTIYSLFRFIGTVPNVVIHPFSWFYSRKKEVADTEEGRRLQERLVPISIIDRVAQAWSYTSGWTKGAVFLGSSLLLGIVGLAFGGSIVLSITSLVLGLSVHSLLVSHHETHTGFG